jgi:transposase
MQNRAPLERIAADVSLPALARELFAIQGNEYALIEAELKVIDAKLIAWHRDNACSRRLSQIPGVGVIGASMLVMKTPDPRLFRSGRQFAAWLGLTPKDHSTAGKVRLGVITRAGDEALRSTLIVGATALLRRVREEAQDLLGGGRPHMTCCYPQRTRNGSSSRRLRPAGMPTRYEIK